MKKFNLRFCIALTALLFASLFLGSCSDDFWEYPSKTKDSSLTVDFSKEYTTNGNVKVTLKQGSARMDGIIYTTDGTTPDVEYDDSKDGNLWYRGNKSTSTSISMTIEDDCELQFLAYRVDDSLETVKYSDVYIEEIDVAETYTFYYDEPDSGVIFTGEEYSFISSKTFTYTRDDEEFKGAHYEVLFTPDDNESGYWELYVIHEGSAVKDTTHNTNYIARGVYFGDCFYGRPLTPSSDNLRLCTLNSQDSWYTISVTSSPSFQLPICKGFIEKVTDNY